MRKLLAGIRWSSLWLSLCAFFWITGLQDWYSGEGLFSGDFLSYLLLGGIFSAGVLVFYNLSRVVHISEPDFEVSPFNRWLIRNRTYLGIFSAMGIAYFATQFDLSNISGILKLCLPALLYLLPLGKFSIRENWFLKPFWVAGCWTYYSLQNLADFSSIYGICQVILIYFLIVTLSILSDYSDLEEDGKWGIQTIAMKMSRSTFLSIHLSVGLIIGVLLGISGHWNESWFPLLISAGVWLEEKIKDEHAKGFFQESMLLMSLIWALVK